MDQFAFSRRELGVFQEPEVTQSTNMNHKLLSCLACMLLVTWGSAAVAVDYYRATGNLSVYFGVLPSELMGHSPEHPEKVTHGSASATGQQHHVVVAVFDTESGRRITDADVTATVGGLGLTSTTKKLEPMSIAGTVSYGNFFQMSRPYQYRFLIKIRPHGVRDRAVDFEFQHPR